MPTLFCTSCGAPWEPGSRFCGECGSPEPTAALPTAALAPIASGPAGPGRPRWLLPVGAGLVALALLVTGAVLLVQHRGSNDEGAAARRTTQVRAARAGFANGLDIRSTPTGAWTLRADDVAPGATTFSSVVTESEELAIDPLVAGNTVVTSVRSDDAQWLVGIDAADGSVAWKTREAGDYLWCRGIDSTRIACFVDRAELVVIDARTGTVLASAQQPAVVTSLSYGDGAVFSYDTGQSESHPDSDRITVTRRAVSDLRAVWTKSYAWDSSQAYGEGAGMSYDHGRLVLAPSPATWVLDAGSGQVLAQNSGDSGSDDAYGTLDPSGYVVRSRYDTDTTTVENTAGFTVVDAPGSAWSTIYNGLIGIGTGLYDVSTGATVWERSDLTGYYLTWTRDHRQVIAGHDAERVVLDPATGETLWQSEGTAGTSEAQTRDAFVEADGGSYDETLDDFSDVTVRAFDRATGDAAWSRTLPVAADEDGGYTGAVVDATDSAVVVVQPTAIQGFTGFGRDWRAGGSSDAVSASPSDDAGSDGGPDYVTACGSEPEFTPVEAADAAGGVTVTVEVHAVCPSGQWLSSTGESIVLSGGTDDSGAAITYASGSFDFSQAPYWVPGSDDDPVRMTLSFPSETTYASAEEINHAIGQKIIVVPCEKEPGATDGEVPDDPADGTDPGTPAIADGPSSTGPDPEGSAQAALRRLAAADKSAVDAWAGHWVPQLASNKDGSVNYQHVVYDYRLILSEHLQLRARYPEVRLIWSGDWRSFKFPDFFVTASGTLSSRWQPAARWCDQHDLSYHYCYAKLLSHTVPWNEASHSAQDLPGR
jgi:hypothetical protein